jgi:hypothetical protein
MRSGLVLASHSWGECGRGQEVRPLAFEPNTSYTLPLLPPRVLPLMSFPNLQPKPLDINEELTALFDWNPRHFHLGPDASQSKASSPSTGWQLAFESVSILATLVTLMNRSQVLEFTRCRRGLPVTVGRRDRSPLASSASVLEIRDPSDNVHILINGKP